RLYPARGLRPHRLLAPADRAGRQDRRHTRHIRAWTWRQWYAHAAGGPRRGWYTRPAGTCGQLGSEWSYLAGKGGFTVRPPLPTRPPHMTTIAGSYNWRRGWGSASSFPRRAGVASAEHLDTTTSRSNP